MKDIQSSFVNEGVTIEQEIEDIELGVNTLLSLGIITNELITNAIKYAFKERSQGKISITLSTFQENMLELSVIDDGIGLSRGVSVSRPKSFGLNLVTMLTEQLSGTIDVQREPETRFRIRFPRTH